MKRSAPPLPTRRREPSAPRLTLRELLAILLLTCGAFTVLGYHPGVEDDTTYLAAVEHRLNPALFPRDLEFVTAQLQFSWYDMVVAGFVRRTHLPLATAALLLQFASLFVLLLASFRIAALCYREASARWAGVGFLAVMLAMPVSGTHLFLADQHLHPRLPATDFILLAVLAILRGKRRRAAPLLLGAVLLHPLMAAFGVSFCCFLLLEQRRPAWWLPRALGSRSAAAALPLAWLREQPNAAWQQATAPRTFLYLYQWPLYLWLTVLGPLALAAWLRSAARRLGEHALETLASALLSYGVFQLAAALVLLAPGAPATLLQFEPMRFLHLFYILLSVLAAGAFGRWWLRGSPARWLLVFVPLAACMWIDQRSEFAGSPHIEWPGRTPANPWLAAFAWIRTHTPTDAYFAVDPHYTEVPLEGVHSFRALAQRSVLLDAVKDRDVVTHVPHLAPRWLQETEAARGWQQFGPADYRRLQGEFGIGWLLVDHQPRGFDCPYHNSMLWVCRLGPEAAPRP